MATQHIFPFGFGREEDVEIFVRVSGSCGSGGIGIHHPHWLTIYPLVNVYIAMENHHPS